MAQFRASAASGRAEIVRTVTGLRWVTMSTQPVSESEAGKHLELTVEDLLRRARPLPPHDVMVIDDLDDEEGMAFLAALEE